MSQLRRTLGAYRGTTLMLNIVLGAGLLTLPGLALAVAGESAIWAWVLCAGASVPLLAVFVIMGKRYPDAGGVAHFARMAFGRLAYVIASFVFLGAVIFGLPSIALVGGHYMNELVPFHPSLWGMAILACATATQLASPEKASRVSATVASCILIALLGIVVVGLNGVDWESVPESILPAAEGSFERALLPFMMIFFAFTGWEVAAGTSEEFRNPSRDFPIAMVLSFVAATMLYLAMAFIVQVTPTAGAHQAPFVSIMLERLGPYGAIAMVLLAVTIITANLMGAIWAVSRMVYSLSRESVLPFKLSTDSAGRPLESVAVVVAALTIVLVLDLLRLMSIETMLGLAGQNFIVLYGMAAAALIALTHSLAERILAISAMVLVGYLVARQGYFAGYPLLLSMLAIVVWVVRGKALRSP